MLAVDGVASTLQHPVLLLKSRAVTAVRCRWLPSGLKTSVRMFTPLLSSVGQLIDSVQSSPLPSNYDQVLHPPHPTNLLLNNHAKIPLLIHI